MSVGKLSQPKGAHVSEFKFKPRKGQRREGCCTSTTRGVVVEAKEMLAEEIANLPREQLEFAR